MSGRKPCAAITRAAMRPISWPARLHVHTAPLEKFPEKYLKRCWTKTPSGYIMKPVEKSTYSKALIYLFLLFCLPDAPHPVFFCYVNPQERKPQAQRDWLDLL